jgi:hypothetical protein
MPETLKQFLENLTPAQAKEIHDWADGDPDAIHQIIEIAYKRAGYNAFQKIG